MKKELKNKLIKDNLGHGPSTAGLTYRYRQDV